MNSNMLAPKLSGGRFHPALRSLDDVVELELLLPADRAAALRRLAQDRSESVGQVLRKMIDRELSHAS